MIDLRLIFAGRSGRFWSTENEKRAHDNRDRHGSKR